MNKTNLILSALAAVTVAGAAVASTAPANPVGHYSGEALAKKAHVSLQTARATALNAHPGQITDQELEREGGGSGLRYSFDIKSVGKTYEVGVDALTGRVLENKAEGSHPD